MAQNAMGRQTFIVQLEPGLARRMREFLASRVHGYASINEFVEVAVLNQLTVEDQVERGVVRERPQGAYAAAPRGGGASHGSLPSSQTAPPPPLLGRPDESDRTALFEPSLPTAEGLSSFTNRLSPIKVAVRVLANMGVGGAWPRVTEFHRAAGEAARWVGFRLREQDTRELKKSVGYPVGADAGKSTARFVASFTILARDGRVSGPLAALGLANLVDGRVGLTAAGWQLAYERSPLLDDIGERGTLSRSEASLLRRVIAACASELAAIREFLEATQNSGGVQTEVDRRIAAARPGWSRDMVIAHRAAMVGRLADVAVLEQAGRGIEGRIGLLPPSAEFLVGASDLKLPGQLRE